MDFDELLEVVIGDERSKTIPIVYIVQTLIIIDEILNKEKKK